MPNRARLPWEGRRPRTVVPVLDHASRLLKLGWSQHHLAIDEQGNPCDPHDLNAVAWSISGAVQVVAFADPVAVTVMETICIAHAQLGQGPYIGWQARATLEDVLALLESAKGCIRPGSNLEINREARVEREESLNDLRKEADWLSSITGDYDPAYFLDPDF